SDQYSFCVTAAECLFDRDPMSSWIRVERRKLAMNSSARRLAALVERGMARQTSARHSSMKALLEGMQAASNRQRRRLIAAAALASLVTVGGVGAVMFGLGTQVASEEPCAAGAARFAKLWNPQRSER